jgi:putative Holliday junction resolvase
MGRVLALDVGERRIGVAISDPTGIVARPLTKIKRSSRQADFEAIGQLVHEHSVERVLVGLPLSLDGTEGPQARTTRRYAQALQETLSVPLEFWDERYSTSTAQDILRARGVRGRDSRQEIDATAAAVILQSYLDAQALDLPGNELGD